MVVNYKTCLIRLPQWATAEIETYAQDKGLAFATAVRCIVVEHLKENTLAKNPTKTKASATTPKV